jgi:hypothetical protein
VLDCRFSKTIIYSMVQGLQNYQLQSGLGTNSMSNKITTKIKLKSTAERYSSLSQYISCCCGDHLRYMALDREIFPCYE